MHLISAELCLSCLTEAKFPQLGLPAGMLGNTGMYSSTTVLA